MLRFSHLARLWLAVVLSLMTGAGAFAVMPMRQTILATGVGQVGMSSNKVSSTVLQARRVAAATRPDLSVTWDNERGIPSLVEGYDLLQEAPVISKGQGMTVAAAPDYQQRAVKVMGSLAGLYGIQDASQEFSPRPAVSSGAGYQHVRLNQTYQGLPVFGGQVIVHFDTKGAARTVNGQYRAVGKVNTTPVLTAAQAQRIAFSDQTFLRNPEGTVDGPRLVIYARDTVPILAYQLVVSYSNGNNQGRWRYWINAMTGDILLRYNDIPSAAPGAGAPAVITGNLLTQEGGASVSINGFKETVGNYYLYSYVDTWYLYNWAISDFVYRNTAAWGSVDRTVISGGYNCAQVENYYRLIQGRNSIDDAGMMLRANIHRTGMVNAYWDGSSINLFDELPCALDVVGHEVTHGVDQYSADLIYADESGALNESMSDIFGTLVEFYTQPDGRASYPGSVPGTADWLMGEDTAPEVGVIRDMRNPAAQGQPSKYKGTHWDPYGEVHQNDGVQNFFFYLLCEGGSGVNDGISYYVPGIGIPAGGKLAYLTLTQYMTPSTDYTMARDDWIAAARETDAEGITTGAVTSVMLAWAAVGIGSAVFVLPESNYAAAGPPTNGPYVPTNKVYSLLNPGSSNITWTVFGTGQPWLDISASSVLVSTGSQGSVTLSINQAVASSMEPGAYLDVVTFTNETGIGNTTRRAVLRIGNNYTITSVDYDWIDPVAGLHTPVVAATGVSAPFALPFPVSLYDIVYFNIYISAHGLVGFVPDGLDSANNSDLPDVAAPNGMICPLWDALDGRLPPGRMYYKVLGTAPNRKIVVTWMRAPHASDQSAAFSFQAIIPEAPVDNANNDIIFQYQDVAEKNATYGSGQSATIGIEDEYSALSRKYSFNGEKWLANQTALKFTQMPTPDAQVPVGAIRAAGGVGQTATFEVKFNESVTGFNTNDVVMTSTIPGVSVSGLVGAGMRYLVSVTNITGYGSVSMSVRSNAVADWAGNSNAFFGPAVYVVQVESVNFSDDMERSPALWTFSTNVFDSLTQKAWQWGVPAYAWGPATAFSGSNCWGTVLTNDYPNGMNAWLLSAPIEVGANPILDFELWYALEYREGPIDMGYVEVDNGSGFVNVTPGLEYSGSSGDWIHQQIVLDNAQFGNRSIRVRFRATSDFSGTLAGMYVDDVVVRSQKAPGVWVVDYSPTNGTPSSTVPVAFTVYNSTTNMYSSVSGDVSSPNTGVSIVTSTVPVSYGTMGPGAVVTGAVSVSVVLAAAGNFTTPNVQLIHQSRSGAAAISSDVLPFTVTGITESVATNVLTVTSGTGVTNWLGQYLKGSGGLTACLYQVIAAGSNGVPDAPTLSGQVTGDDRVLYASATFLPWGRFGEGSGIPPDFGRFLRAFNHGVAPGSKVFVRAWDASSFEGSVAYGDSPLYTIVAGSSQSVDFGTWTVGVPLPSGRDSDGDGILDAYCVTNHMDPRYTIGPLAPSWSLAQDPLGSVGTAAQQFNGAMPSPTRLFYKGNYMFVLDTGNNRIQIWNRLTRQYMGAYGAQGSGNGFFKRPVGLALDPSTNRFAVADQGNYRIQVFSFDPLVPTNINFEFFFGVDELQKPTDVAIDAAGRFYVTDQRVTSVDKSVVEVFNAAGVDLGAMATAGSTPGKVHNPGGVCVAPDGTIIVADTENNRVQAFDSGWNLIWPTNGTNTVSFSMPRGVQIGLSGRVYVADTDNSQIKILKKDGSYIATLGSHGYGFNLVMNHPYGLMPVVESNIVYVADTYNNRVLTIAPIYDGDGDGMDDIWEELHGLDPNVNDAMSNSFGLGIPNIGVYRLGLNPAAFVPIRITAFSVIPPNLQWVTATNGGIYQVEYSYDSWRIASNSWVTGPVYTSAVNGTASMSSGLTLTNKVQYIRVKRLSP